MSFKPFDAQATSQFRRKPTVFRPASRNAAFLELPVESGEQFVVNAFHELHQHAENGDEINFDVVRPVDYLI